MILFNSFVNIINIMDANTINVNNISEEYYDYNYV